MCKMFVGFYVHICVRFFRVRKGFDEACESILFAGCLVEKGFFPRFCILGGLRPPNDHISFD